MTAHTLALLPRGARVVNIASGILIDEEALADALDSGHISAAGLDVHANESVVNPRFVGKRRNVQLTCHTAGASVETSSSFEHLAMLNVEAVLTGKQPLTPVNDREVRDKMLEMNRKKFEQTEFSETVSGSDRGETSSNMRSTLVNA